MVKGAYRFLSIVSVQHKLRVLSNYLCSLLRGGYNLASGGDIFLINTGPILLETLDNQFIDIYGVIIVGNIAAFLP